MPIAEEGNDLGELQTVPKHRLDTVAEQRRAALAQVAALTTQVEALTDRAAAADTLATQLEAARAELGTKVAAWGEERALWGEERALWGAGITDPEDADLVRYHYGRIPEKDRPATIAEHVAALRAEGATVPKALQYIFASVVEPKVEAVERKASAKPPPRTPANSGRTPSTAESVSAEALKELRMKFMASDSAEDKAVWQGAADAAKKARGW